MQKEFFTSKEDHSYREYAIGMAKTADKYIQFTTKFQIFVKKGTLFELIGKEGNSLCCIYYLYIPSIAKTIKYLDVYDDLEDLFERYIPNYNKIWNLVNEY
jgi:hypothetical protein